MDYSVHMLARTEHEQMVRSLPSVPEYGYHLAERKTLRQKLTAGWLRPILILVLHLLNK